MTVFERVRMPLFDGATEWLNSEPLGPAERGHVNTMKETHLISCRAYMLSGRVSIAM